MKISSASYGSGWALIEVLLTMIVTSATILGSLHLLEGLHITERTIQQRHEAYSLASQYKAQILTGDQNGLKSIDFYQTLTTDFAVGLTTGVVNRDIGLHMPNQQYTVTWTITPHYTQEGSLYDSAKSDGAPYPLMKRASIDVIWYTEDGSPTTIHTQVAILHPLVDARIDKLFQLNQIQPGP